MSCPLFHNKVKKLWVYKPLLDSPFLAGRVFICPINRNGFVYSPFSATITRVRTTISDAFDDIEFDNGVILNMNNEFELKVGDYVSEGQIIGSCYPISYAGFDSSQFSDAESTRIVPNIFSVSGDTDISGIIGEEVRSVPNDTFATVDVACTGVGAIMIFDSLYIPGKVIRTGSVGDEIDPGTLPTYAGRTFDGWYYGREFAEKYDGSIKYDGINFLWGKWSFANSGKVTIVGKQNIAPGKIIKDVTYDYSLNQYSNFEFPWMLDEDEEDIFGGLGVISVIGSQLLGSNIIQSGNEQFGWDLQFSFTRIAVTDGEISISPFVMLNSSPGERNCGIFFSPVGSQVVYNDGGVLEQTLYSSDAEWSASSYSESNSPAPGVFTHAASLEPDYKGAIYVAKYSRGGSPIQKQAYSPDIIPILTMFSSRITGRPSINMHNRFIFG